MSEDDDRQEAAEDGIGLCARCRHMRSQNTKRGAVFYRCGRADEDDRFMRYPPIPVAHCPGHENRPGRKERPDDQAAWDVTQSE